MKRWISGRELLQRWDWTALELLDHIKAGLPAYVDEVGRRLLNEDTLPRQKQTFKEIEDLVRSKWINLKPSDEEICSELCEKLYEGQSYTPVIPPTCKALSFTVLTSLEAPELLNIIESLRFKYRDIVVFEQNNRSAHNAKAAAGASVNDQLTTQLLTETKSEGAPEEYKLMALEEELRNLESFKPATPKESLDKERSIKAAQRRLKSLTEPKLSNQRHRSRVRKIAEKLWQDNPNWTIQKMIKSDKINAATTPRAYAERTLRDWVKDLAPDRRRGRRPKAL